MGSFFGWGARLLLLSIVLTTGTVGRTFADDKPLDWLAPNDTDATSFASDTASNLEELIPSKSAALRVLPKATNVFSWGMTAYDNYGAYQRGELNVEQALGGTIGSVGAGVVFGAIALVECKPTWGSKGVSCAVFAASAGYLASKRTEFEMKRLLKDVSMPKSASRPPARVGGEQSTSDANGCRFVAIDDTAKQRACNGRKPPPQETKAQDDCQWISRQQYIEFMSASPEANDAVVDPTTGNVQLCGLPPQLTCEQQRAQGLIAPDATCMATIGQP